MVFSEELLNLLLNNIKDINIKEKLIKIGDEILSSIIKKLDQYIIH